MDSLIKEEISTLYKEGLSIRKIERAINYRYRRESIRMELKKAGVPMRGRFITYKNLDFFNSDERLLFAEFLGYLYGDGSLHKNKNPSHGLYDCVITFSLDEGDLVNRVIFIVKKLFSFNPKVIRNRDDNTYSIKFRRSFAKYISLLGYPAGKKSINNPLILNSIFHNSEMEKSFIKGFLNAEATINRALSVQQSVGMTLSRRKIDKLKSLARNGMSKGNLYSFVRWKKAKKVISTHYKDSNILLGLKNMLSKVGINVKIYPVRVYIGKNDKISIHLELKVRKEDLNKIRDFNLLSCKDKLKKLDNFLQK